MKPPRLPSFMRATLASALITASMWAVSPLQAAAPQSAAVTPVPAFAQGRVATAQVRVAPDHADWTYKIGEPVRFTVFVTADNGPLTGVTVTYKVGPEMMPAEEQTAIVPAGGLVIDGGTLKQPGFIRCIVTATVGGKTYRGLATAGFAPDKNYAHADRAG